MTTLGTQFTIFRNMAKQITFTFDGATFTADTEERAARLFRLLKEQTAQADQARQRIEETSRRLAAARFAAEHGSAADKMELAIQEEEQAAWTPEKFMSFMERLGEPQIAALRVLLKRRRVTDEELRKALKVSGNQALAGLLSGISKQAAAVGIPARAIFTIENLRNAGKRRNIYAVSDKFLYIASLMNFPPPAPAE